MGSSVRSTAQLRCGLRPQAGQLLGVLGFVLGSVLTSPPLAAQEPGNFAVIAGVRSGIGTSAEQKERGPCCFG